VLIGPTQMGSGRCLLVIFTLLLSTQHLVNQAMEAPLSFQTRTAISPF